jgi:hypothetical protein
MDGNGHDRAHLDWREGSDEAPRAAMTFDPSAVLRAIEDEDDGDVAPTPSAAAVTPDLNEALRAAMSYEGVQDHDLDGDEPNGEWTETDEDAPDLTDPDEDDVAAAWRGEVEANEAHETPGDEDGEEDLSAIADGEDDAEEWTESGEDEDVFQAAPAPLRGWTISTGPTASLASRSWASSAPARAHCPTC